ncbi:MAG: cache domain-containing protein, partial [Firmicutes bacterium]|nr:cache domain-containing protein [Bacillota bacterium]
MKNPKNHVTDHNRIPISDIQDSAEIRVDLHCHSSWSDGNLPPAEVAYLLYQNGVRVASLTDHDTIMGLKAFQKALAQYDIGYVAGVEITATHHNETVHILAYGFDEENETLRGLFNFRPVAASDELVEIEHRTSADVIGMIHRAGGIAILAHPLSTQPDVQKLTKLVGELKTLGLDGIEALYGPDTADQTETLLALAEEHALAASMGTDFHDLATDTPGITVDRKAWDAFRDALLHTPFAAHIAAEQSEGKKRKNEWFSFALNIILPAVLSLALFVVSLFVFFLPYFEQTLLNIKRENIRQLSQASYGVLAEAVQEVNAGRMTLADAQTLAKDRISAMRYGVDDKDYFWIQDLTPRILMHPYRTDLNNQDVSEFTDAEGNRIFVEFADLARNRGEGYIHYVWQWMDDPGRVEAKESYIRYFEPWGWVIGTGIYTNDVQTEINILRGYIVVISGGVIGIVLILLIYLIHHGMGLERSRLDTEKRLIESTHRYKALSEAATEGALFIAGERCRYANAVVYEMLGCAYGRIDLLYLRDVFPQVE